MLTPRVRFLNDSFRDDWPALAPRVGNYRVRPTGTTALKPVRAGLSLVHGGVLIGLAVAALMLVLAPMALYRECPTIWKSVELLPLLGLATMIAGKARCLTAVLDRTTYRLIVAAVVVEVLCPICYVLGLLGFDSSQTGLVGFLSLWASNGTFAVTLKRVATEAGQAKLASHADRFAKYVASIVSAWLALMAGSLLFSEPSTGSQALDLREVISFIALMLFLLGCHAIYLYIRLLADLKQALRVAA